MAGPVPMGFLSKLFKKKAGGERRSSRRRSSRLRFVVTGRDEYGSSFKVRVEVLDVSGQGGRLAMDRDVREGAPLRLHAPDGTKFTINVRWCEYDMNEDRRHVGFQIIDSAQSWNRLMSKVFLD